MEIDLPQKQLSTFKLDQKPGYTLLEMEAFSFPLWQNARQAVTENLESSGSTQASEQDKSKATTSSSTHASPTFHSRISLSNESLRKQALDIYPSYRLSNRAHIQGVVLLLGLLVLFRFEAFATLGERVFGGVSADAGLYYWLVKEFSLQTGNFGWFTNSAGFPYTKNLAWSDSFLFPSLVGSLFVKAGVSLAAVYSGLLLAANTLGAYLVFRLAFRFSGHHLGSLLSGVAAIVCALYCSRLGHPQLQFWFFLPLCLSLALHALERRSILWGFAGGVSLFCAFLSSVYLAIYAAIAGGCFVLALKIIHPNLLPRPYWLRVVGGYLCSIPLFVPFVIPYFQVKEVFGSRYLYEQHFLSADLAGFIAAPEFNWLYGGLSSFAPAESRWFVGVGLYLLVILSIWYLLRPRSLRRHALFLLPSLSLFVLCLVYRHTSRSAEICAALLAWVLLAQSILFLRRLGKLERAHEYQIFTGRDFLAATLFCCLTAFILCFGPLGNAAEGEFTLSPGALAYYVVPGFSSLRAPARFWFVFITYGFLLIPFAFRLLPTNARSAKVSCFLLFAVLICAENYQLKYALEPAPKRMEFSDYLQANGKEGDVVAYLPMATSFKPNGSIDSWGSFARVNVPYLIENVDTGLRTINAYSGLRTKMMKELPRRMRGFPDAHSIATLESIPGLHWIVFSPEEAYLEDELRRKIAPFSNRLTVHAQDENGRVLFGLEPLTRVTERTELRFPSIEGGTLQLELRARFEPDENSAASQAELTLVELDHNDGKAFAKIAIPRTGLFNSYSIPVPPVARAAHPLRVAFRPEKGASIQLRRRQIFDR